MPLCGDIYEDDVCAEGVWTVLLTTMYNFLNYLLVGKHFTCCLCANHSLVSLWPYYIYYLLVYDWHIVRKLREDSNLTYVCEFEMRCITLLKNYEIIPNTLRNAHRTYQMTHIKYKCHHISFITIAKFIEMMNRFRLLISQSCSQFKMTDAHILAIAANKGTL